MNLSEIKLFICIPGNRFSGRFFDCWNAFLSALVTRGVCFSVVRREGSFIEHVRSDCLGGTFKGGPDQALFNGAEYTHILWIDSDQIFAFADFERLLSRDLSIVGGIYPAASGKCLSAGYLDREYFLENGHFKVLQASDIADKTGPIDVDFIGFGFLLVKKGVFELVGFPWFAQRSLSFDNKQVTLSEDVSFCLSAFDMGIPVHVDPLVRIGHEKPLIMSIDAGAS